MKVDYNSIAVRYGCGLLFVAMAIGVRLLLNPLMGDGYAFITLFFAILATAWVGGFGPAIVAVALGGILSCYFVLAPRGSFAVERPEQRVALLIYVLTGVGTAMLGGAMRAAQRRAEDSMREARRRVELIDQTYDALLVWDLHGAITFWNRGAERLYGIRREDALGRVSHELLQTGAPIGVEGIVKTLERTASWEGELEHTIGNKASITVESRMVLVREGEGAYVIEVNRDISEMKESEARLRTVTDSAGVGLVIVDEAHCYRYANRAYTEILNLPTGTLVGRRVEDVLTPVYETQIRPRLNRVFNGERVSYELRLPPPSQGGEDRYYAVSYEPSVDRSGKIVVVVIAEITSIKRAEEANARLSAIVHSSSDAIIGKSLDGTITSWNGGAEKIFGFSEHEALGRPMRMLFPSDLVEDEAELLAKIERGDSPPSFETQRLRKDGSRMNVALTISPVENSDGQITGVSVIARDISERKRAEEARVLLAAVVNSSSDAIIAKDLHGIVSSWNPAAQKIFGYSAEEMIGNSITRIIPPDRLDDEKEILDRIRRGEAIEHFETVRQRKDGGLIDVSVTVSPIKDSKGNISGASKVARDITEQNRAQRAQRESEEQFRTMANSIPQLAWMARGDGFIFWYNQRWHDYTGTTPDQMEGWGWQSVHDPDVLPNVLERWRGALATGQPFEMEFPLRGADGRFRMFLTRGQPLKDSQDCVVQWFGTCTDVDELKHMEQSLRDTQARLNSTLAAGSIGTWTWDIVNDRLAADEFTARMFSIEASAAAKGVPAESYLQAVFEDDRPGVKDALAEAIRSRGGYDIEYRVRQKDGECRWLQAKGRAECDCAGNASHFHGAVMDITDRKRAEELRRASEERYHTLFENAPDGIVIADPQSYYLDANASICRMLGYTHDELIGLHATDIVVPAEVPHIDVALNRIKSNSNYHREWQFRRKDGSVFEAEVIATMMPDGNLLGMIRDVSERKRADTTLREAEKQKQLAFEASRLKSEFLANMSHELRTPLNCIIGFTEFLFDEKPGPLNPKQKEYLTDVHNSSKHLLQLINDVLDLAKVEAGKIVLNLESFPLAKAIEEVCAVVKGIAQKKAVTVISRVAPGIPAVTLDAQKFKQVCYNLMSNAVKFTDPAGSVEITALARERGQFEVRVRDTGIGISEKDLPRLFREFEQLESGADRRFEGTGLGLALTKKLVEAMGGSIGVESEYGKGSTFFAILPTSAREAKEHE